MDKKRIDTVPMNARQRPLLLKIWHHIRFGFIWRILKIEPRTGTLLPCGSIWLGKLNVNQLEILESWTKDAVPLPKFTLGGETGPFVLPYHRKEIGDEENK